MELKSLKLSSVATMTYVLGGVAIMFALIINFMVDV